MAPVQQQLRQTNLVVVPISLWGLSPPPAAAAAAAAAVVAHPHTAVASAFQSKKVIGNHAPKKSAHHCHPPPPLGLLEIPTSALHLALLLPREIDCLDDAHGNEEQQGEYPVPDQIELVGKFDDEDNWSVQSDDLFSIASAPKHLLPQPPAAAAARHSKPKENNILQEVDELTPRTATTQETDHTQTPPKHIIMSNVVPKQEKVEVQARETRHSLPFSSCMPLYHNNKSSSQFSVASLPFVSVASHLTLLSVRRRRHSAGAGCMFSCFQLQPTPPHEKAESTDSTTSSSDTCCSSSHPSATSSTAAAVAGSRNNSSNLSAATETDEEFRSSWGAVGVAASDEDESAMGSAAATIATTEEYDWENLQQQQQQVTVKHVSVFDNENDNEFWNKYRRRIRLLKQLQRFVTRHEGQPCRYTIRIMDDDHDRDRMPMEFRIYQSAGKRRLPSEPYTVVYGSAGILEWMEPWMDLVEWFSERPLPLFDVWFNKLDIHMDEVDVNDARQIFQRQFYVSI